MTVFDALRGGLIVSVQAWPDSAIDDPRVIAAMARAAQDGGAVAVRIAGDANLRAVRQRVALPIIGLVKREYAGFEPYITPTLAEVADVIAAQAEIVAVDATARPRPDDSTLEDVVMVAHAARRAVMADCSSIEDAQRALAAGVDAIATTLCGYTAQTKGRTLPALDLVAEIARLSGFTICEGGVHQPAQLRAALDAGADAVVVGTAITNTDWLVREFAGAARKSC
jgi:N-acylglucosamine-6-phosphate 2-epimerase